MNIKVYFIFSEIKAFTDNHLGYVSDEQIERFCYRVQVMEEPY